MATVAYPPISQFPVSLTRVADFAAVNNMEYPVDTRNAVVNVTPPTYGAGVIPGAVTVVAGAVTAIAAPAAGARGKNYTPYCQVVFAGTFTTSPIATPTLANDGSITGFTIVSGGAGCTGVLTASVIPGPKLGDRVVITDAFGSFGVFPVVFKTSVANNALRGVAGDDLALVQSGMSECIVFTADQGWLVSAGS